MHWLFYSLLTVPNWFSNIQDIIVYGHFETRKYGNFRIVDVYIVTWP